jgi:hypothetical protein
MIAMAALWYCPSMDATTETKPEKRARVVIMLGSR